LRLDDGRVGLLRDRAGDYVRDTIAENLGMEGELEALDNVPGGRCNRDVCIMDYRRDGEAPMRILATRSNTYLDWPAFIGSCALADIVISDRRLPAACQPRWLKLDRTQLNQRGGVAIRFVSREVVSSHDPRDRHPWIIRPAPSARRFAKEAGRSGS
jgi:competence protein ComEC